MNWKVLIFQIIPHGENKEKVIQHMIVKGKPKITSLKTCMIWPHLPKDLFGSYRCCNEYHKYITDIAKILDSSLNYFVK